MVHRDEHRDRDGHRGRQDGRRGQREHRGRQDGAYPGVVESDGHLGSSDVGVAESGGRWRSLAGPDVAREPRLHQRDAAWGGWSWDHRATRYAGRRSASAALRCGCVPSWLRSVLRRPAPARRGLEREIQPRGREPGPRPRGPGQLLPAGVPGRLPRRAWPYPCPWPSRAPRAVLHDGDHRRRHDDEYGQPGRPQSRQRGSMHQCLTSEPARATPCSLARAPLRARVPGSSSAPKRSLTSVPAMAGTVPYSFTTTADLTPWANFSHAASAASSNRVRSAFCAWWRASRSPHRVSVHHHRPRPLPRPTYHCPSGERPARVSSTSERRWRQTTQVRSGLMLRPPRPLRPPRFPRGRRRRR